MSHRLGLDVADLGDGQVEAFGDDPPRHRDGQRIAKTEAQSQDVGKLVGHAVEQIWIIRFGLRGRAILVAQRLLGTVLDGHRRADPVPGVRRQSGTAIGIEPIDGSDQSDRSRLHRVAELLAGEPPEARPHGHRAHPGGDERFASVAVSTSGEPGERELLGGVHRREGEQLAYESVHATSVRRRSGGGRCRERGLWTARRARISWGCRRRASDHAGCGTAARGR
nr:hypothetical protein [Aeromicrobium ginsengisoli]